MRASIAFAVAFVLTTVAYFVAESALNHGDSIGYGLFRLASPLLVPLFFCVSFIVALGIAAVFAPGDPPLDSTTDPSPQTPLSSEERLSQLDRLRDQSLITAAEYEAKREEILNQL